MSIFNTYRVKTLLYRKTADVMDRKLLALTILFVMISSTSITYNGSALDSDGDGVDDSVDDCPFAFGNSTVDRNGCPDRDGDGKSDLNDGWTTTNPNFQIEQQITGTSYYSVDHNSDGSLIATASGNRIRIFDTNIHANTITSSELVTGNDAYVTSLDWSPDDNYIAATLSDDTATILWASNMSIIHEDISHSGSSRTFSDVAFFPNSTAIAVVDEASGGWGGGTCTGCAVMLISVETGSVYQEVTPAGNSGSYSSVAFSSDGSRMAVGEDGTAYIIETENWTTVRTLNPNAGANVHSIDFSPDGNTVAMCTGYDNGNSRLRAFDVSTGNSILNKQATSSCYGTDVSPDGKQVAFTIGYYSSDGGSALVYELSSTNLISRIQLARGSSSCNQNGGQNPCGNVNSASWHPGAAHIVLGVSRNYEGLYFMYADLDPDNDGWNTTDQGDGKVDAFPDEPTQWADSDGDGFGDNPLPANRGDDCTNTFGKSDEDRFGCPDSDLDGWSDADAGWPANPEGTADTFPNDPMQWADSDLDGHGDNYYYDVQQITELHINQSGDAFPNNPTQWNDSDGDGWGDNYHDSSWDEFRPSEWPGNYDSTATQVDKFPLFRYQWKDSDNDWIGDEPNTPVSDGCPNLYGNSTQDRLGCIDSDGDGWSNPTAGAPAHPEGDADAFPEDPTQWRDTDSDGFGDNTSGNNADDCPGEYGTSTVDRVGCPDVDGDGYSNAGDPFPQDGTQWEDQDGDNYGDNPDGNNPDEFPYDSSQWKDSDGDGYGDRPVPPNGDMFPNDPTQWSDTDNDGFGDNPEGNNGDVCPETYGKSELPGARGCPDSDNDGVVDPYDAFPEDFYQQTDNDGDGWGDNQDVPNGDECPEEYGTSTNMSIQGCPDTDGDSWADSVDEFPEDPLQWKDTDKDGWGDNYGWTNKTIADEVDVGLLIVVRDQWGDAFPTDATQWSDTDGDGFGDNQTGRLPDAFPVRSSQWADSDGDGYGDNHALGSFQPDECELKFGESFIDYFGCPDSDKDGVSDQTDPCPYDADVYLGIKGQVACASFDDADGDGIPDEFDLDYVGTSEEGTWDLGGELFILAGLIVFLLAIITVAMVAKQAGRRKSAFKRAEEMKVNAMMADEEERRLEWIEYYVNQGDTAKAMELGWTPPQEIPQWQQYQMQQQQSQQDSVPGMMSLDDI